MGTILITNESRTDRHAAAAEQYRTDQYDSLYEWDEHAKAYVFRAKLNGRTVDECVADLHALENDDWV
jgi:hypothetical protein